MQFAQFKAAGQAPPAVVLFAGLGIYAATWSSAAFIQHEIEVWSNRHDAPIQAPVAPQVTPTSSPSPIASATPNPAPVPPIDASAGKRRERIPDLPPSPAPSPTVIATPFSPPFVVPLPPDLPAGPPIVGNVRPRPVAPVMPRHPWPPIYRERPDEERGAGLPRHEFGPGDGEPRYPWPGRGEGHPRSPFGGGFPFMPRRPWGGFFRPHLPFGGGGFGHRFF
jgi:hypothetical protein